MLAVVAVAGVVYGVAYGPDDVNVEDRELARGAGFEVPVPEGFGVVEDDRVPAAAAGGVALADSVGEGVDSGIIIVPVAPGARFDPTELTACEEMARETAAMTGGTFQGAKIIEARDMETCEFVLKKSDTQQARMVLVYEGDEKLAVTCMAGRGDRRASDACDRVVETIDFVDD